MDHAYIEAARIADRYLAHELSAAEAQEFERHFADCPECLDRLALAEIFRQRHNGTAPTGDAQGLAPAVPEGREPAAGVGATAEHVEPEPELGTEAVSPVDNATARHATPDRAFNMILLNAQATPATPTRPGFFDQFSAMQLAALGALAGLALLSVPSLVFFFHAREMSRQLEQARKARLPALIASVRLEADRVPVLSLTSDSAFALLLPEVAPSPGGAGRIRASIADLGGRIVWTGVLPDSPGGLALAIPVEVLASGEHALLLQRLNAQGESSELGRFGFRVQTGASR